MRRQAGPKQNQLPMARLEHIQVNLHMGINKPFAAKNRFSRAGEVDEYYRVY
jgi:hypothetical protein